MYKFIKSTLAAGILFISLITSVALSYAITPISEKSEIKSPIPNHIQFKHKEIRFNINKTIKLLIPNVSG